MESVSFNDYIITVEQTFEVQALDLFDRIVSDLPSWYGYVAYEVSDGSWVLITGSEYSKNDNNLLFGDDTKASYVSLVDNQLTFTGYNAPGASVSLESNKIYYTNLVSGYPSLGDTEISFSKFAGLALIVVVIAAVFNRNSRR